MWEVAGRLGGCAPMCLTANKSLYYTFFPTIVRQPANISRLSKIGKIPNLYVRQPADVSIDFDNFLLGPKIVRQPATVSRLRTEFEK